MKKVNGRVLVKESHVGIADLVVVVFGLAQKGASPKRAALSNSKTRLASGFTDKDGRFELQIESNFDANAESTNDFSLIIGVFAPDDGDIPSSKAGAQKSQLYLSPTPRLAPASTEAFIIRIPLAALSKLHIKTPADRDFTPVGSAELAKSVKAQAEGRAAAVNEKKARMLSEHKKTLRFHKYGKEMVRQLTGVPRHRLIGESHNNDLLIAKREDLPTRLKPLQDKVVTDGLRRMAAPSHKPKIHLRLNETDLHELGLKFVKGELTGTPKASKIAAKIRMLHGGLDLIKVRGLRNPSPDELERRYLRSEIPAKLAAANNNHKNLKSKTTKRS